MFCILRSGHYTGRTPPVGVGGYLSVLGVQITGLHPPTPAHQLDSVQGLQRSSRVAQLRVCGQCTMRYTGQGGRTIPIGSVVYMGLEGCQGPGLRPPPLSSRLDIGPVMRLSSRGARSLDCVQCTMRYTGQDGAAIPVGLG